MPPGGWTLGWCRGTKRKEGLWRDWLEGPAGTQRTGLAPGEGRLAPLGCHHKQVGWAEAWDLVLRWETCPRWYPEKKEATSLRPRRWWKPAVLRLLAGGVLAPNLGTHYWASRACCTGNNGVIDPTT